METHVCKEVYQVKVNGRLVAIEEREPTARQILDRAGFAGRFCLAATHGDGGKVIRTFGDSDRVNVEEHRDFRATFCGPEVVS